MRRTVTAPAAVGSVARSLVFRGGRSIHHRELVTSVIGGGSDAFVTHFIPVSIGNPAFARWGAAVARNYEKYIITNLKFSYCGFCPSTVNGIVCMMFDSDPADPTPRSRQAFMDNAYAISGVAWSNFDIAVPGSNPDPRLRQALDFGTMRWTDDRQGGFVSRLNSIGCIHWGSELTGSATGLGDIFVEYDVEFVTPTYSTETVNGGLEGAPTDRQLPFVGLKVPTALTSRCQFQEGNRLDISPRSALQLIIQTTGTGVGGSGPDVTAVAGETGTLEYSLLTGATHNAAATIGTYIWKMINTSYGNIGSWKFNFAGIMDTISAIKVLIAASPYKPTDEDDFADALAEADFDGLVTQND